MTKIKVGDFTRPDLYYASLKFTQPAKGKEITKDGPAERGTILFTADSLLDTEVHPGPPQLPLQAEDGRQ